MQTMEKVKYTIKPEYAKEDSLYYHIDEVVIIAQNDGIAKVYDVNDGHEFWIELNKLELAGGNL